MCPLLNPLCAREGGGNARQFFGGLSLRTPPLRPRGRGECPPIFWRPPFAYTPSEGKRSPIRLAPPLRTPPVRGNARQFVSCFWLKMSPPEPGAYLGLTWALPGPYLGLTLAFLCPYPGFTCVLPSLSLCLRYLYILISRRTPSSTTTSAPMSHPTLYLHNV